jgi:hypothetical protein
MQALAVTEPGIHPPFLWAVPTGSVKHQAKLHLYMSLELCVSYGMPSYLLRGGLFDL